MNIILTPMTEADLADVLEIENSSFPTPWSIRLFLNELENPCSHIIMAKDDAGILLGYVSFRLIVDEAHILNLAVHKMFRREGIARHLLSHVLKFAKEKGANIFLLEVRNLNIAALKLYKGFGFREAGIRKGYYADTGEDAILMELVL
mgnify:FL=1